MSNKHAEVKLLLVMDGKVVECKVPLDAQVVGNATAPFIPPPCHPSPKAAYLFGVLAAHLPKCVSCFW